jgi:hypothetical protein
MNTYAHFFTHSPIYLVTQTLPHVYISTNSSTSLSDYSLIYSFIHSAIHSVTRSIMLHFNDSPNFPSVHSSHIHPFANHYKPTHPISLLLSTHPLIPHPWTHPSVQKMTGTPTLLIFVIFVRPSTQRPCQCHKQGQDRCLPRPYQFISH